MSDNNFTDDDSNNLHVQNDTEEFYAAGILPFAIKNNNSIYVLLGQDKDRRWSDFGGKSEKSDDNDPEKTAVREFFEETCDSVLDEISIHKNISNKKCYQINDKTGKGFQYYMYLVKISFKEEYITNFKTVMNFLKKYQYKENTMIDRKYLEKFELQWFPLDVIKQSIKNKDDYLLRPIFKGTLEKNIEIIDKYCKECLLEEQLKNI